MRETGKDLHLIGCVCSIMLRSRTYCQYPILCISEWIRPAILLDQILLFDDEAGNLSGYITWALLAEDVENRIVSDPNVLLHISEWNEGDRLWIMDMVVLNGDLKRHLRHMLSQFSGFNEAKFIRRREDGTVRKVSVFGRDNLCRALMVRA